MTHKDKCDKYILKQGVLDMLHNVKEIVIYSTKP